MAITFHITTRVERTTSFVLEIGSNLVQYRHIMALYFIGIFLALFVCIVFLLYMLSEMFFSLRTDAPFLHTPKRIFEKLIKILELKEDSILYDLGCGDAQILRRISLDYPHIKMVGVEMSFLPYLLARYKTRKDENITIRMENIFDSNIEDATHIFTYLFPKGMEKLMPVIEKKCKSGTVVVSCDFEDKNRTATEIVDLDTLAKRGKRIIVYKI